MGFMDQICSLLVILACTLSGGLDESRPTRIRDKPESCQRGAVWPECVQMDQRITEKDLMVPWCTVFGVLAVLSVPSIVFRARNKTLVLQAVAGNCLRCFALLVLCSTVSSGHLCIRFVMSMHSCFALLRRFEPADRGAGLAWWWGITRLAAGAGLLLWSTFFGPVVSVVRWSVSAAEEDLTCALLAHLLGCIVPSCTLSLLDFVLWGGRIMLGESDFMSRCI